MKNYLLLFISLLFISSLSAQIFFEDDFEAYPLGEFIDGQGGWVVEAEDPTTVQIIERNSSGKSMQLQSTFETNESGLFVTQYYDWEDRDSGNDILTLEVDFYTGNVVEGFGMLIIASEDFDIILEMGWDMEEELLYIYSDGEEETLLENATPETWYQFTANYNVETGDVFARVDEENIVHIEAEPLQIPAVFDFTSILASEIGMDNIKLSAEKENFLSTPSFEQTTTQVTLYPNPTSDYINIQSDKQISNLDVYDIKGRKISATSNQNQINTYDWSAGKYFLNILFIDGSIENHQVIKR